MLEGSVNITATGSKEGQTEQLSTTDSVVFMGVEPGSRLAALVTEEQISLDDIEHIDAGKAALLGKGAFGEVRKVIWRKTPAAAKVCHESMPHQQKMLFLRELELMVRCRHPNIVQFLGYVDHPFIIVMEYLPAGDLRAYWQSRSLAVPHKTRICIDILRGLGYLHNRKPSSIIHRDIKPTNVLMTLSGVAKITDFGLSRLKQAGKAAADATPEAGRMRPTAVSTRTAPAYPVSSCEYHHDNTKEVGTVPYMAPEANMQGYDEKVDIYSAAITFYELFEQTRFEGFDMWALAPVNLRPIIKKMGAERPADRPSALELVETFATTQPPRKLAPQPPESSACCVVC